jgi:hypothetical protein
VLISSFQAPSSWQQLASWAEMFAWSSRTSELHECGHQIGTG